MVVGIGGAFIYSQDPAALADWYSKVLDFETHEPGAPWIGQEFPIREADGERRLTRCVWAIFQSDEKHPASPTSFTINYRVDDMDATLAHAASSGVTPDRHEDHAYGRFAWLTDPEGREIELWQDVMTS
jgi:predicted enzyme related to lactoylglutathione lyase